MCIIIWHISFFFFGVISAEARLTEWVLNNAHIREQKNVPLLYMAIDIVCMINDSMSKKSVYIQKYSNKPKPILF